MEELKKGQTTSRCNSVSPRRKRSLVEKNRRFHMKDLISKLSSLIPSSQNSKHSVTESVEQATTYTKQLQERIEKLNERKELLLKGDENLEALVDIKSSESTIEVTIVSGFKKHFLLSHVISVLEEEGAQVVSTTYHNACDRVFYTIYAQPIILRIGIETSRVEERLKQLIS